MIVLVPDEHGLRAFAGDPNVQAVKYEVDGALPPGADAAQALVAGLGPPGRLRPLLQRLPRLELVQTLSAGVERWRGTLPPGVRLSNARGAHGAATAEWAAAALLAVYRELPRFVIAQREQRWHPDTTETLDAKRVLIVGAGDLARELARRLEPFGASITLVGRRARDGIHATAELPALLPGHDAVVLMVPLTADTEKLADRGFLAAMPDGAVLVNAARGGVLDTDALLAELRTGRLRAALDVTEPEPLPAEHPLWQAPGLLLTPHVGGNTTGVQERGWSVAARQVALFAEGREPENLVGADELRE